MNGKENNYKTETTISQDEVDAAVRRHLQNGGGGASVNVVRRGQPEQHRDAGFTTTMINVVNLPAEHGSFPNQ